MVYVSVRATPLRPMAAATAFHSGASGSAGRVAGAGAPGAGGPTSAAYAGGEVSAVAGLGASLQLLKAPPQQLRVIVESVGRRRRRMLVRMVTPKAGSGRGGDRTRGSQASRLNGEGGRLARSSRHLLPSGRSLPVSRRRLKVV